MVSSPLEICVNRRNRRMDGVVSEVGIVKREVMCGTRGDCRAALAMTCVVFVTVLS